MFWRNKRSEYGYVGIGEKVQMYECQFTCTVAVASGSKRRHNMRCLVVCNAVEEAIAACRNRWPSDFVLHQVSKRNQACDLIVVESVLLLAEKSA